MRDQKKTAVRPWLFLALLAVFVCAALMLGRDLTRSWGESRRFAQLRALAYAGQASGAEAPGKGPAAQMAALSRQNRDFWGWLTIADTGIDYPVMHTPQEPEYYLRRNFDGESAVSGVPFVGVGSATDGGNLIVHGHNMKDGSLFADLLKYREPQFYESHPLVCLTTCSDRRIYEIFAAIESRALAADEQGFRYYENFQFSDDAAFCAYMQGISALALYDTGVSVSRDEPLLILSTCAYQIQGGRFAVLAKLISQTPL